MDLALTITKERLQQDQNLAERTNLSVDNILKLSGFVLNHNYFKYDGNHYKQIFGCAMGSPISPVLAELVMDEIEETAISQLPHPPKWWFRYVDDSHSCLKKDQVDEFHKHLNSINPNIQFTLELENTNGQGLPFLDTITSRRGTEIQVDVYRKPIHADRYLNFFSRHPLCHKRSVVNTLLKRGNNIPLTNKGRRKETQRVKAVLRDNSSPMPFIQNCERALTKQPADNNFHGFVVLPYVQGVSEKIGRIFKQQKVKIAYKPQLTINSLFPRLKELDGSDRQKSGIVYKINCTQCKFVYYGQTERSLKTRIAEHKNAVAGFDQISKIASNVHHFSHNVNFENVKVVGFEANYHEQLFLEAWHSTLDPNAGNDHIVLPEAYKGIARAWIAWSPAEASRYVTLNSVR